MKDYETSLSVLEKAREFALQHADTTLLLHSSTAHVIDASDVIAQLSFGARVCLSNL
jgi:hypothetical protein